MIGRIFVGIWRGLDGLRKFLHLVVLLTIFGFVVGALRTSIPHIADTSALVIAPQGRDRRAALRQPGGPGDGPRCRAMRRAETLLWDLVDALKAAKKDARITAVVLDLDSMTAGGQPTLAEFTAAIKDFRSSGKKVVAHATSFLQESYYVAARGRRDLPRSDGPRRPSTATSATAPTTRISSTSSASRSICSASAPTRARPKSTSAPTCRPRIARKSLAYLNALWFSYRKAVAEARGLTPDRHLRLRQQFRARHAGGEGRCREGGAGCEAGHRAQVIARRRAAHGRARRRRRSEEDRREGRGGQERRRRDRTTPRRSRITCASCRPRRRRDGAGKDKIGVIIASGEILDGSQPPGNGGR